MKPHVTEPQAELNRGSDSVERLVRHCASCGVTYWEANGCPSCKCTKWLPVTNPAAQPERGAGSLCASCQNQSSCPPSANLYLYRDGSETCWEFVPNDQMRDG